MTTTQSYDLVVIGSGPAGEVGAIRAAQLGMKVALVEKNQHLGGTCLNVGCIPTKALLEAAKTWRKLSHLEALGFSATKLSYSWPQIMQRKEGIVDAQRKGLRFLMKKNNIDVLEGKGTFKDAQTIVIKGAGKETVIKTKHTLIATGSTVWEPPFATVDHQQVMTSDSILFLDHVPESLAVIGGGVVGMEFASLFASFGTKVSVFELLPQVLPTEDPECVKELLRYLKKLNIEIFNEVQVEKITSDKKNAVVQCKGKEAQKFSKALISIGRKPNTGDLGLGPLGIQLDKKGFIPVDSHYRTDVASIFAVGDVIATPALAHTGSAEAMHAVSVIAGHTPPLIDYQTNPSAVYTYPEIASIGLTEAKAKEKGLDVKVAKFPFAPMAKAKIEDATEGFIKIVATKAHHEIIGVHIVGARATELIAEFALGKVLEATVDEIGHTIHPHPTISETVMEAAHALMHGAIHM